MLRLADITKAYGQRRVLRQLSAACEPGETLVVMGQNGSGKSTLLKIAAGLVEADDGTVELCGERVSPGTVTGRRHLGYLPDAPDAFPDLTVSELVTLSDALKRAATPEEELAGWIKRLDLGATLAQPLRTLSFGQRKRAFLLSAVIGQPWLLILDEPSNGLDPPSCLTLAQIVRERREQGLGALIGSNDPAFVAELGGRVSRIVEGRLAPA
jgi:ABC-2 type transport system ATP-binding protein